MSISKEFIKANLKHINGFLPVYKPKNICSNKLLNCIKNELYFCLDHYDVKHGRLEVSYARHLDTHASGLLTFILGHGNYRRRNFVYADYKYKLKIEFGVEREFNTIDGEILENCQFDHINSENINTALKQFQGSVLQKKSNTYFDRDLKTLNLSNDNNYDNNSGIVQCLYRLMPMDNLESDSRRKLKCNEQKYPLEQQLRQSTCHINLIDYISPFGWFDVTSSGSFSTRQFVYDLAEILNTKASQVDLVRIKEGPITLDDMRIIQFHENNFETYIERLLSLDSLYNSYIESFDHMFETPMRLRNRIK